MRFYGALGLAADAIARSGHWIELAASGGELGLHDAAKAADGEGRSGVMLGFVADEPLEAPRGAAARGWLPARRRHRRSGVGRSLFVRAPDGTLLQIDEQDRELYIVDDVEAAIAFYRDRLEFTEVMHPAPTFAMLTRGDLRLVLSAPGGGPGGGAPIPDGTMPRSGGWNRFAIEVEDLAATVKNLRGAGVKFRNDSVDGVGGRQIIAEDPSGNPIELFQPTRPEARL